LIPDSEALGDVGLTVTYGGDALFVITANAEVEFTFTADLSVDASEYVLFKDDGAFRVPKCAKEWRWDAFSHDYLGQFSEPDPLPSPVSYAYTPVVYYDADSDEITACDI
jgi:hypothetical protein